jgi:hypothetical protein
MLGHFHYIREADGTYTLEYSFPEPLRLELLSPKYFRFLSLKEIAKFRCKYGLKLYEFCFSFLNPQRDSICTPWIDEEKLRALLGCEKLYRTAKSFKQWVLNPAIKETNAVSEVTLKLNQRGRGEGHRQFQFLITRKPRALYNGLVNEIPAFCPSDEDFHKTTEERVGFEEPSPQLALPLADSPTVEPAQDSRPPLPDGTLPHEQEEEFFSLIPLSAAEKQLWFSSTRLVCFEGQPCLFFPASFQMNQVLENFSSLLQTTARNIDLFPLSFRSLSNSSPEEGLAADVVTAAEAEADAQNLA